ncbi:MAG: phosphatidate cytidylyltransferase [Opitutales bacterium]
MTQRIVSTTILWLSLIAILMLFQTVGGLIIILVVALLTQAELYGLFRKMDQRADAKTGLICGGLVVVVPYLTGRPDASADVLAFCLIVLTLTILGRNMFAGRVRSLGATLFGLVYVPFLFHFFVRLIQLCEIEGLGAGVGKYLAIWIVAVAKFTDVGGLLAGRQFGRTPLAPAISPKKTYEGCLGGLALSALVAAILAALGPVFFETFPKAFTPWLAALIAVPVAIASIASDLIESQLKRAAGVKDSGTIVPGIGGVFDLTDSIILCAPLGYLLIKYLAL